MSNGDTKQISELIRNDELENPDGGTPVRVKTRVKIKRETGSFNLFKLN